MRLEHKQNYAIREEIGERLKVLLAREQPNLSTHLDLLVQRFYELDQDAAPSIVPDADPMAIAPEADPKTDPMDEQPEPSSTSAWLQRLRDFTRRS